MIRAGLVALALFAAVACGKYGPPVRSAAEPAVPGAEASAAPAGADTEECEDPNAPPPPAGTMP
ncbi:MAG: hypothetical protein WEF50_00955 [Myxococcota bacterium]